MLFWCDLKFEKGEKNVRQKADSNRVDRVKMSMTQALPSAPLELTTISRTL